MTASGQRGQEITSWRLPDANIEWRPREEAGKVVAVEVHTGITVALTGQTVKRLENSRVFFVPSAAKGGKP